MKWIKGRDGLPSLFKKVQWRNADGGNIPLGEATPLEHYKKTGANIEWHEWLNSSHPEQGEQGEVYKWVKASERLPEFGILVSAKINGNPTVGKFKQLTSIWFEPQDSDVIYEYNDKYNTIEWLCKLSSPPPQDERIKKLEAEVKRLKQYEPKTGCDDAAKYYKDDDEYFRDHAREADNLEENNLR